MPNCYICDSSSIIRLPDKDDFTVLQCETCKLKWVPDISSEVIERFYNEQYVQSDTIIGYQNYIADERTHRLNAKILLRTVSRLRKLKRLKILNVGVVVNF